MRYAYIKNGDVIAQLQRIIDAEGVSITSGPDAFLSDFIRWVEGSSVLLIGYGAKNAQMRHQAIMARVFYEGRGFAQRTILKIITFFKIILSLWIYKPDRIICGQTGSTFLACFIISSIRSIPIVHSRHNQIILNFIPWYKRIRISLDIWCMRRVSGVVCHGPYLKEQALSIGIPSSRVYAFDISFEHTVVQQGHGAIRNKLKFLDKSIILYIGRIQRDKGVFDLLEALDEKIRNDQSIVLVYAGDGVHWKALQDSIMTRGLESDRVVLLGAVPHQELFGLISYSKIVVTPTQPAFPEGRCMVAMESLVMGVPVVAPDFGPFRFLVSSEFNGMLFKAGSIEDLRRKLLALLDDCILYNKVKEGALDSRETLMSSTLSFSQALQKAFS